MGDHVYDKLNDLKHGIRAHRGSNLVVTDGILTDADLSLAHELEVGAVVGIRDGVAESCMNSLMSNCHSIEMI